MQRYPVVIIGGGPAGTACALALVQRGMTDILIVEAGDYSQFRIGESIPPETIRLLRHLVVERVFLQQNHSPCYGSCSYWGSDKRGYNDTIMNPLGHGWHLDRCKFNGFLAEIARNRGVYIRTKTKLKCSTPSPDGGFELELTDTSVHADFVVDASGARTVFARQRGSKKVNTLPLICLAARFTTKNNPSGMTHLEAVEQGWWYGANLPDQSLLLTFYSDPQTVKSQRLQQRQNWMAVLANAPNTVSLIDGEPISKGITSFVAPSHCLDKRHGPDWLAIGDAASAYDPLTSQGIIKSLANGISAADVIVGRANMAQFAESIEADYRHYLIQRRHYYQLEQRWPDSAFWLRHHGQQLCELPARMCASQ